MNEVEVRPAAADALSEPLKLLEEALRDGEPLPQAFAGRLARDVERGDLEILTARSGGRCVGVAVLAFRPGVSLGTHFASVEELHVKPEERGRGVGRALLARLLAEAPRAELREVVAVIALADDPASVALHRACGFREVGVLERVGFKHGRWVDTLLMQRSLGTRPRHPPR